MSQITSPGSAASCADAAVRTRFMDDNEPQ